MEDLLDRVVIDDSNVTRREDQLDQLCSVLLLKLESDKQAKSQPNTPPFFRPLESASKTAELLRRRHERFTGLYPEIFTAEEDRTLRLTDETLYVCVSVLAALKLLDLGVSTIAIAFQVLRSAALKQEEGQYFTPQSVIEAGVRLLQIDFADLVLDPACGTGGFLVEAMLDLHRRNPSMSEHELSRWTQTHVHGIDKDAIAIKLTKAFMQIAGNGSARCVRGDSIRTHNWENDYPHLRSPHFANGRFDVVVTNPPFGKKLRVSATDCRLAGLKLAKRPNGSYKELEIGLLFLERAHQLLKPGGRLGIVLPETYFFSPSYAFVFPWMKSRFVPRVVANVPMEAFQGFCRAKTNFYVLEKVTE